MKIVIKENNLATIHDQLDEQGVRDTPLTVRAINILFHSDVEESIGYLEAKKDALLFSLQDWGIIDDIESIEVFYESNIQPGIEYKAEVKLVV